MKQNEIRMAELESEWGNLGLNFWNGSESERTILEWECNESLGMGHSETTGQTDVGVVKMKTSLSSNFRCWKVPPQLKFELNKVSDPWVPQWNQNRIGIGMGNLKFWLKKQNETGWGLNRNRNADARGQNFRMAPEWKIGDSRIIPKVPNTEYFAKLNVARRL